MSGSLTQSYFILDCPINKVGRKIFFGLDDDLPPSINEDEFLQNIGATKEAGDKKSKTGSRRDSKVSGFSKLTKNTGALKLNTGLSDK